MAYVEKNLKEIGAETSSVFEITDNLQGFTISDIYTNSTIQVDRLRKGEKDQVVYPEMTVLQYNDMFNVITLRPNVPTVIATNNKLDLFTCLLSKNGSLVISTDDKYRVTLKNLPTSTSVVKSLNNHILGDRISMQRMFLEAKNESIPVDVKDVQYLFFPDPLKRPDFLNYMSHSSEPFNVNLNPSQIEYLMNSSRITTRIRPLVTSTDSDCGFHIGLYGNSWVIPVDRLYEVTVNRDSSDDIEFWSISV